MTDAGLAHPVPPDGSDGHAVAGLVTVVIPVRDRAAMLDRCLAALGCAHPVIVVDDGSADGAEIAGVVRRHGAQLHRRPVSGGPAAARNTGLAGVQTELVAFLDSDCQPPAGWIGELAAHLADPLVGAVAPRIIASAAVATAPQATAPVATGTSPSACRYEQARGSLDLGDQAGRVMPGSRVSYVPTAALLVRRAALADLAMGGEIFDAALRYGEDVDLIWRLHAAGWRIRYVPSVRVAHQSPDTWPALLARRFRYGTSAAPLARRHPANLAPLVLQPWPAAAAGAALAGRPALAAAGLAAAWLDLTRTVRRAGLPADGAPAAAADRRSGRRGSASAGTPPSSPCPRSRSRWLARGGWRRRAAAASLLLGPALTSYAQRRPGLDPVRFSLAHIADDVCYGAGVMHWLCRRAHCRSAPAGAVAAAAAISSEGRSHERLV